MKTGCNYCKLVAFKKQEEEGSEVTMSGAAAGEISLDTVVATVLLELDGIFALQGEQRMALKVYYDFTPRPTLRLAGFAKSFVTHCGIVAHRKWFWQVSRLNPQPRGSLANLQWKKQNHLSFYFASDFELCQRPFVIILSSLECSWNTFGGIWEKFSLTGSGLWSALLNFTFFAKSSQFLNILLTETKSNRLV